MIVVFVTLLQPEDSNPLFGITTPRTNEASGLPAPGSYAGPDREHGDGRENRPGTIRSVGGPPAVAGSTAGGVVGDGVVETPEADDGEAGEPSPTDDQYADTLTRLADRLN